MAKLKNLNELQEVVEKFKAENPLKDGERYDRTALYQLGRELEPLCGEVAGSMVFFSYHAIWFVCKLLDEDFSFDLQFDDYNNYTKETTLLKGGAFYKVTYKSSKLPECKQEIQWAIRDNGKFVEVPTGKDIDEGGFRAMVKCVALNSWLGYSAWLEGEDMKKVVQAANRVPFGATMPQQARPQVQQASNGMVANVQTAPIPQAPKPQIQQPTMQQTFQTKTITQQVTQPQNLIQQPQQVIQQPTPQPTTMSVDKTTLQTQLMNKITTDADYMSKVQNWLTTNNKIFNIPSFTVEELQTLLTL